MNSKIQTLADAFLVEIARCQELLEQYRAIGPVGIFGYTMIKDDIDFALKATAEGDAVGMLRAYQALKGCK